MHVVTVTGHTPGDYVHPDQKLQIIDEETGKKYELIIRSNASSETGELSIFIPITAIQEIQTDKDYCVLTLSGVTSKADEQARRKRMAGVRIAAKKG